MSQRPRLLPRDSEPQTVPPVALLERVKRRVPPRALCSKDVHDPVVRGRRQSAIAVNRAGDQLFVPVSNATTAPALAQGMQRAGGWNVAQLDVNWSHPRFLIFPLEKSGEREAATLFHGFPYEPDEMLRRPATRDFFYVVRRSPR